MLGERQENNMTEWKHEEKEKEKKGRRQSGQSVKRKKRSLIIESSFYLNIFLKNFFFIKNKLLSFKNLLECTWFIFSFLKEKI